MVCIQLPVSLVKRKTIMFILCVILLFAFYPRYKKTNSKLVTSVYRKLIFIELYSHWESFCHAPSWFILVCSTNKLEQELGFIKKRFCDNGYSLDIVQSSINAGITQFHKSKDFGPKNVLHIIDCHRLEKFMWKLLCKYLPVLSKSYFFD